MTSTCITTHPHLHLSPPHTSYVNKMHDSTTNSSVPEPSVSQQKLSDLPEQPDPEPSDNVDFEFSVEEPVNILPADQLFSDGKLFPLHFPVIHPVATSSSGSSSSSSVLTAPLDALDVSPIINGVSVVDSFLYTPKAPKCSSKWKELLGLRKLYQNSSNVKQGNTVTTSSSSSLQSSGNGNGSTAIKSIKHFLYRSSKSSTDSSVNLPLLNDTDNEAASVPSRQSLSSSSSGHDPDEIPRLSLDSEKQMKNTNPNPNLNNPPRMKLVKTRTLSTDGSIRGVSTESPRMNSSGKIVFHSLERSSSSPSSFNGGPRLKNRGMERSYSGNVRITPVLNVPVCSLRGFPLFSSSQKHEGCSSNNNSSSNRGASRNQHMNNKR